MAQWQNDTAVSRRMIRRYKDKLKRGAGDRARSRAVHQEAVRLKAQIERLKEKRPRREIAKLRS
jgi:hypothetical protein